MLSTARPPALHYPGLANHQDPVTTDHLPGGKRESVPEGSDSPVKEIDMTVDNEQHVASTLPGRVTP